MARQRTERITQVKRGARMRSRRRQTREIGRTAEEIAPRVSARDRTCVPRALVCAFFLFIFLVRPAPLDPSPSSRPLCLYVFAAICPCQNFAGPEEGARSKNCRCEVDGFLMGFWARGGGSIVVAAGFFSFAEERDAVELLFLLRA